MAKSFSGRVTRVLFSGEGTFYVLRMVEDQSKQEIALRGNIPGISVDVGTWFAFEGNWVEHPKFGKQIEITKAPVTPKSGWTSESVIATLESRGVLPWDTTRLLEVFGDELPSVLNSPVAIKKLVEADFTESAAQYILSRWGVSKTLFQVSGMLEDVNIPKSTLQKIWKVLGDDAYTTLSTNPWAILEIEGTSISHADEIATKIGIPLDSPLRASGIILALLNSAQDEGHMYLSATEIFNELKSKNPVDLPVFGQILKNLKTLGKVIVEKGSEGTRVYLKQLHHDESEAAKLLARRWHNILTAPPEVTHDYTSKLALVGPKAKEVFESDPTNVREIAEAAIQEWVQHSNLQLSEKQLEGAKNALTAPCSIITGLPGTGKSTSLRVIIKVLQDAGIPFIAVAPTGIAAKRIQTLTGAPASTIHRAFGAKSNDFESLGVNPDIATYAGVIDSQGNKNLDWVWGEDAQADVIIIDEASMVDTHLLYRVMACTKPTCRVLFVGDPAQLPSVGPGYVLNDLISTKIFPTVSLSEIFRQDSTSSIVLASHSIHRGEMPEDLTRDFHFEEIQDGASVVQRILDRVGKLHEGRENFQVLSPRHKGTAGVTNLNLCIRERLNPSSSGLREMKIYSEILREGDRVMIVKNDYQLGLFNGEVGKVEEINLERKRVVVRIFGAKLMDVEIPLREVSKLLRLAYAQTVHRCQGQEYDTIVMPLTREFGNQLYRNLVYTAVTRAKKQVYIYGSLAALGRAIHTVDQNTRNTYLPQYVGDFLEKIKAEELEVPVDA